MNPNVISMINELGYCAIIAVGIMMVSVIALNIVSKNKGLMKEYAMICGNVVIFFVIGTIEALIHKYFPGYNEMVVLLVSTIIFNAWFLWVDLSEDNDEEGSF